MSSFGVCEVKELTMNDELKKKVADLEARTLALFSHEDVRQAMTIHGDYIPKKTK